MPHTREVLQDESGLNFKARGCIEKDIALKTWLSSSFHQIQCQELCSKLLKVHSTKTPTSNSWRWNAQNSRIHMLLRLKSSTSKKEKYRNAKASKASKTSRTFLWIKKPHQIEWSKYSSYIDKEMLLYERYMQTTSSNVLKHLLQHRVAVILTMLPRSRDTRLLNVIAKKKNPQSMLPLTWNFYYHFLFSTSNSQPPAPRAKIYNASSLTPRFRNFPEKHSLAWTPHHQTLTLYIAQTFPRKPQASTLITKSTANQGTSASRSTSGKNSPIGFHTHADQDSAATRGWSVGILG